MNTAFNNFNSSDKLQTLNLTKLETLLKPDQVSFPLQIKLYVPNRDADGNEINQGFWSTHFIQAFSHYFGGASVYPQIEGHWYNPKSRRIIEEKSLLITSYAEADDFVSHADKIRALIIRFGKQSKQGEVLLEINNTVCRFTKFGG